MGRGCVKVSAETEQFAVEFTTCIEPSKVDLLLPEPKVDSLLEVSLRLLWGYASPDLLSADI
jgi:hypothetical protein